MTESRDASKRTYDNGDISSPNGDHLSRKRRMNSNGSQIKPSSHEELSADRVGASGNGTLTRSPSPIIDLNGISRTTAAGTRERRDENQEQANVRLEKMQAAVRTLLECVGEDVNREGLEKTPLRYAKALLSLTEGYQANIEDTINNALFHEGRDGMVIVKDIEIFSLCEHHLMPFTGKASPSSSHTRHHRTWTMLADFSLKMHIGYIPSDTVIGLSKLPRIAEIFSRRLQIQERLTKQVAHAIMDALTPQGVAVIMESSHLCMVVRGVGKTSAITLTSCFLGSFDGESDMQSQFLKLVGKH
ncbi:hypothetical protein AK830_g8588 [Neonectria ditissima]|uniref:GTP cyclohydrolase 1 n=1 Tax=Neonectria ditissima TaxID=78410 RepID=A0A0P7BBX7_9HYPO|nr:hypothetical protein AK830_g8588 [Neonectria ditissima]